MGLVALRRLPKKLHNPLASAVHAVADGLMPEGWGVYIIEGYCWAKLRRGGIFAATLMLLVAILWCVLTRDIQGGMGIGQCSVGFLTMMLALLVMGRTEPE